MTKNIQLQTLVAELKKASSINEANIWKRVANDLDKSTRNKRIVNLNKISQFCKDGEVIIVPGKILGSGDIDKKLTIAAYQLSDQAYQKIKDAKGTVVDIMDLVKKNPKGSGVRIIG